MPSGPYLFPRSPGVYLEGDEVGGTVMRQALLDETRTGARGLIRSDYAGGQFVNRLPYQGGSIPNP
jgi:hypothetical protein